MSILSFFVFVGPFWGAAALSYFREARHVHGMLLSSLDIVSSP